MYSYNNPVRFIDPDGEGPGDVVKGYLAGSGKAVVDRIIFLPGIMNTVSAFTQADTKGKVGMVLGASMAPAISIKENSVPHLVETAVKEYNEGGDGFKTGATVGKVATDFSIDGSMAIAGAGTSIASSTGSKVVSTATNAGTKITNPIPTTLARVIPAEIESTTLGAKGASDVFVTAAKDIKGLDASQIATKLTIPTNAKGFKVIEFKTIFEGISSPIKRNNPGFVGRGKTLEGAREFTIPNQEIPKDAIIKIIE